MTKREKILVGIVLSIIIFVIWGKQGLMDPKSSGRDTVISLGDGTFQILRSYIDTDSGEMEVYNLANEVSIAGFILKYRIMKKDNIIYVIGKKQYEDTEYEYTILNYKTGTYQKYPSIEELNDNDKIIFQDQSLFKIPGD